jgi:hypothetical protein
MSIITSAFQNENRSLANDTEAIIVQFLRSNFVALGLGLESPALKSVVFMPVQSMVAEHFLEPMIVDSDSDEWYGTCLNLAAEGDLEISKYWPFNFWNSRFMISSTLQIIRSE